MSQNSSSRNSRSRKSPSSRSNEENETITQEVRYKPTASAYYDGEFSQALKDLHRRITYKEKQNKVSVTPNTKGRPYAKPKGGAKRRRTKKRKNNKLKTI
jgi:hypothetical protein